MDQYLTRVSMHHQTGTLKILRVDLLTLDVFAMLLMLVTGAGLGLRKDLFQLFFSSNLGFREDGGVNGVPSICQPICTYDGSHSISNAFIEMSRASAKRLGVQLQFGSHQFHRFFAVERADIDHATDHQIARLTVTLRMAQGIEVGRILDTANDGRTFQGREILGLLAEVSERSGTYSIITPSKINTVEIEFENLRLGVALLDAVRQEHLGNLTLHAGLTALLALFLQVVGIARQLLGNGARSLSGLARLEIKISRTHHADVIDTLMLIKALILAGTQGINKDLGHVFDADDATILDKKSANFFAVTVDNQTWVFDFVDQLQIVLSGTITIGFCVIDQVLVNKKAANTQGNGQAEDSKQQAEPEATAQKEDALALGFVACCVFKAHDGANLLWPARGESRHIHCYPIRTPPATLP